MTCGHARVLAQHSACRCVAVCDCEGGIVHVSWDVATLHLCFQDFCAFAHVLETASLEPVLKQRYHLQLGTVALILLPHDYALLKELVQVALGQLSAPPHALAETTLAKALN